MDYHLEPPYPRYPHHHDQLASGLSVYADAQAMHNFAMAQHHHSAMMAMPVKQNETKPRLGKGEVDILEREFKKNPKPTTQKKRSFAEDMGVDLARINNWFQNRRAKQKQEKKQEAYEANQNREAQVTSVSEPSSPDNYSSSNELFGDSIAPLQHAATFPIIGGPPPAAASCNPQYSNPSNASMESLQRTLAAAKAGQGELQHDVSSFPDHDEPSYGYGGPIIHDSSASDRAQFSSPEDSFVFPTDNASGYTFPSSYVNNQFGPSLLELQQVGNEQTPTNFSSHQSREEIMMQPLLIPQFPSQLIQHQGQDALPALSNSSDSQSPDGSNASSAVYTHGEAQEPEQTLPAPPPSSTPFKIPRPPANIASRRNVQHKPAALIADTLRGRPSLGPRTVSQADGFRRQIESPLGSPMRRIVSAGGNRNGMAGRIQKPNCDSAQRSPINLNGYGDFPTLLEHNMHNFHSTPTLTAAPSVNNSLAPPTPLSPRGLSLSRLDRTNSNGSPTEGGMHFVYNAGGDFRPVEGDQNLASPPETPHTQLGINLSSNGFPQGVEFSEEQWHFETSDEPLHTPALDGFPSINSELHMPQPGYLSSISQPPTPAFGTFGQNFMFETESPQVNDSPTFTLATQGPTEYNFNDGPPQYPYGMLPSSMNKHKTFQFSNSTAADFSEK